MLKPMSAGLVTKDMSESTLIELWANQVYTDSPCRVITGVPQAVGVGRDAIVSKFQWNWCRLRAVQDAVEMKFDLASQKTGNLYVEYEQTFDNRLHWQKSGCALAVGQADVFVMCGWFSDRWWFFSGTPTAWMKRVERCKVLETNNNSNGNRDGCYSKGYVMPILGGIFVEDEHGSTRGRRNGVRHEQSHQAS